MSELTEERVREIAREETLKVIRELQKSEHAEKKEWMDIINGVYIPSPSGNASSGKS